MARDFDGSADYLYFDATSIDETAQLSVSAMLYADNTTSARVIQLSGSAGGGLKIAYHGDGGDYWHFLTRADASTGNYGNTTSHKLRGASSTGAWASVVGNRADDGTVDSAYIDGSALSDTAGGAWGTGANNENLYIGARADTFLRFNGKVAEVALWQGVTITAAEAAALSAGYSPLTIQPSALVFYAPMVGRYASEIDFVGGLTATHVSAPPVFVHPRVFYPKRRLVFPASAGGGGGGGRTQRLTLLGVG